MLVWPFRRLCSPEMVEHDRERQLLDVILQRSDNVRPRVKLDVPAATVDLFGGKVECTFRVVGINFPIRRRIEIEPNTANTCGSHFIDLGLRCVLVNDGDATSAGAELANGVERAR